MALTAAEKMRAYRARKREAKPKKTPKPNSVRQQERRERIRQNTGAQEQVLKYDRKRKRDHYAKNRERLAAKVQERARKRAAQLKVLKEEANYCRLKTQFFCKMSRLSSFKKKMRYGKLLHYWQVKHAYAQGKVDREAGVQFLRQLRYRTQRRLKRQEEARHKALRRETEKLLQAQLKKIQVPLKVFRLNSRCPHCKAPYDSFSEKDRCCQKKKCIVPNGVHPWFPQEYVDDVLRCDIALRDGRIVQIPPYQRESVANEINNKLQFAFMGTTYDKRDYGGNGFSRTATTGGKHKGVTIRPRHPS